MASVSGATSSLGNTSLRGFGGLASGIDRDEMIDAMTAGTQAKIDSQKSDITKLQWKQEAYRSIIDKIIDMEDEYFSFVSGSNLKDSALFAKSIVTALGDSDITKFVKASGVSAWVDNLSIKAVDRLATAATTMSGEKGDVTSIKTGITGIQQEFEMSDLAGLKLEFGTMGTEGKFNTAATFTFPTSYTETVNGEQVTKDIDYSQDPDKLVEELNRAVEQSKFKIGEKGTLKFELVDADGNPTTDGSGKISIKIEGTDQKYNIRSTSSALTALGYSTDGLTDDEKEAKEITLDDFNKRVSSDFKDTYTNRTMQEYLKGKKLTVTYGGQTKTIDLLKAEDIKKDADGNDIQLTDAEFEKLIQDRLDKAFGTGKVKAGFEDGVLAFKNAKDDDKQTLTINSTDAQVRTIIGIEEKASNKLSMKASLFYNQEKLFGSKKYATEEELTNALADFKINGTAITGLTADTTVDELVNKINTTKDAGVKASYLSNSNQFLLVASETGEGREIKLEGAASEIFNGTSKDGQDAQIRVSYGNGVDQVIKSSTNTFDLEGMSVTVSGTFGYAEGTPEQDKLDGTAQIDGSQTVTFSAKADVDGTTEKVKKFFEAYNALIEEVNKQVTTRPDNKVGPLTDAQKEEMDEKSIENWENKAKEGILFNDGSMRDFSTALEGIMTQLMNSGIKYSDLEEMGITMSDDYLDGGKIIFDETKFKAAMEKDPELVSNIFTGGGGVQKGMMSVIEDTFTPYATRYRSRNGNSYGRLIEEAGSEKVPLSVSNNWIYNQLKIMEDTITTLKAQLKTEQDQYISKFTMMESLINKFNSQAGYLSQLQG